MPILLLTCWVVFRRSFQFSVIYLHHLHMRIKMSLQSALRLMRAVKMIFTVQKKHCRQKKKDASSFQ